MAPVATDSPRLVRAMGLLGLISTALSAMVGVGINIIPFMLQRSQPGIGGAVPLAFVIAALPAALAALCYAILASAMPRAGGSYVYATRALNPFAGFLASFAQWLGLSIGMGVVAYLLVPMLRDIVATAGWPDLAPAFDRGSVRAPLALAAIWMFWWVNMRGIRTYERTIVVMAVAMIVGPVVMTIVGFANGPAEFARALAEKSITPPPPVPLPGFSPTAFAASCVTLFSSFIGFDAISQAGGEARNPARNLPLSIVIAIGFVALYYIAFTASVYHAVPWEHIYRVSLVQDISAPALLAPLMPRWLGLVILLAVGVAILNSIPSVMLANSRILFAFGVDGIFPDALARLHSRYRTPRAAVTVTAVAGSASVLGCALAGEFFLGVDLLVVSMLVNFLLVAAAVITLPAVNPGLYRDVAFLRSRAAQRWIAGTAIALLGALLIVQVARDVTSPAPWYLRATTAWLAAMAAGSAVYARFWRRLRQKGIDPRAEIFSRLPDD